MNKSKCGAKTASGKPCKKAPMANGRCYKHGGATPKGINSPNFKHGRHSKYLPKGLLTAYESASKDPDLLSVRAEIALMDVMLSGLLPKLGTADNGKSWQDLKKTMRDIRQAVAHNDPTLLKDGLNQIDGIINANISYYETEREIKDTVESRRKLVETEQKIALQGERAIGVEQLMVLMSQVLHVIQSVVTEDKQRRAIAIGLQELISLPPS